MTTRGSTLTVSGIRVQVVRKAIKHLHLGVYPPDGRVRVAVPLAVPDSSVRLAVIDKLRWIRAQQATFAGQAREGRREMVAGESHYYLGRRYRLRVTEAYGKTGAAVQGQAILLRAHPRMTTAQRERVLQRWYRERLTELAGGLVARWASRLGVTPSSVGIKRMKTRWGSCTPSSRRIWLNLELAKKPLECIEYLVLHELAHLIHRHHDQHFQALLDRHLPRWRAIRRQLNAAPLASEGWDH